MVLSDLIVEGLVLLDIEVNSQTEILKKMSNQLYNKGYVRESYGEGIENREKKYPTGIEFPGSYNAAIPHTDPEHVKQSAICLGIPKTPVVFHSIEDAAKEVEISVIFMIAMNKDGKQVEVLQSLMEVLQNQEFMSKLLVAKKTADVIQLFQNYKKEKEVYV